MALRRGEEPRFVVIHDGCLPEVEDEVLVRFAPGDAPVAVTLAERDRRIGDRAWPSDLASGKPLAPRPCCGMRSRSPARMSCASADPDP
jgi:hypothetical protein